MSYYIAGYSLYSFRQSLIATQARITSSIAQARKLTLYGICVFFCELVQSCTRRCHLFKVAFQSRLVGSWMFPDGQLTRLKPRLHHNLCVWSFLNALRAERILSMYYFPPGKIIPPVAPSFAFFSIRARMPFHQMPFSTSNAFSMQNR